MESINTRIILSGIFIILAIISGIWLHHKGRPLHATIFNVHKLISLAAIAFTILAYIAFRKNMEFADNESLFILLTGIFLLFNFASGGMLSFEKPFNYIVLFAHRISTVLFLAGGIYTIYLVLNTQ